MITALCPDTLTNGPNQEISQWFQVQKANVAQGDQAFDREDGIKALQSDLK